MTQAVPIAPMSSTLTSNVIYAGFGSRLLAALIDVFILAIFNFILGLVLTIPLTLALGGNQDSNFAAGLSGMLLQLVSLATNYGYFIYFIGKNGQTLGKKALKIKVVNIETQQPPGYVNAFLREVIGKMISALIIGIGYLWMIWDPKKQTLHDKIAHTVVIKV